MPNCYKCGKSFGRNEFKISLGKSSIKRNWLFIEKTIKESHAYMVCHECFEEIKKFLERKI